MKSRFSLKQFLTFVFIFFVGILLLCLHHATPSATKKQSVSYTQTEFIEEIAPTIQKVAASYGVRPSIIIAQAVLESNYGTNLLAVKYHNLFAVQAQDGQTAIELTYKSYFVNEWQTETGRFAVYKSWTAAIYDYFDLLQSGKLSDGAYDILVSNTGYKKPAQSLQDMGFSTDPDYATKLIAIIEQNNFTAYAK